MKTKKAIAFITALIMAAGSQVVFVSAVETDVQENLLSEIPEITEEVTEEPDDAPLITIDDDYTEWYDEGGLMKIPHDVTEEELDEWRAEACVWDKEKGTIGGWNILGEIKNAEGRSYYYTWEISNNYTCYAHEDLAVLSVSSSVARPGQITYVDISVDGAATLSVLYGLLKYDRSALKLVSASIDESIECAVREPSEENRIPDFTAAQNGCFMYFNNNLANVDLSGEHTIRFGFEVSKDAEEGEYEIGITNTENGGLTGLARNEYCGDDWLFVYVPVKYVSGSVKVSKTEAPETRLEPKPLRRTYALIDGADSIMTGDVNEDGTINVLDVLYEKDYFVNIESEVRNADTNEDGIVNMADVMTLVEYIIE